jgi:peptidoglycan/xylan/chitin deacetylase (PgdA/CDA1 family)
VRLARLLIPLCVVLSWALLVHDAMRPVGALPLLGAQLGLIALAVSAAFFPHWQVFGPAFSRGPRDRNEVALTFDDGPHPRWTRVVLDALDAAGHRATFFLIGERVAQHPELAREIVSRGHQVALHGHDHRWQVLFWPRRIARDFALGLQAVRDACGRLPRCYRPPIGLAGPATLTAVADWGFTLVGWTLRPYDGRGGTAGALRERLHSVGPGDVVLLHDAPTSRPESEPPLAVEVLPDLLLDLKARGLRSVPIATMLGVDPWLVEDPAPMRRPVPARRHPIEWFVGLTLLALLLAAIRPAAAASPALPPSLVQAARALGTHEAVEARFEHRKTSILFAQPLLRTGTLSLRRSDGRLVWAYDDGLAFLMAGGRFYPAGKTKEEAGKDGAQGWSLPGGPEWTSILEALLRLDTAVLERHFDGVEQGAGRWKLEAREEKLRGLFGTVVLDIGGSPQVLRQVRIEEGTGDVTELVFTQTNVAATIPKERFWTPEERSRGKEP